MKKCRYLFLLLPLFIASCQPYAHKKTASIIDEPRSMIQEWYGPDHFENTSDNESNQKDNSCSDSSSGFTPAGSIFSKELLDQHSLDSLPKQESFFSHYLFRDDTDLQAELTLSEVDEEMH